jgi:hypothetical protein
MLGLFSILLDNQHGIASGIGSAIVSHCGLYSAEVTLETNKGKYFIVHTFSVVAILPSL